MNYKGYAAESNEVLSVPLEIHARAAMMAEAHGKSLNSWVTDLLSSAVDLHCVNDVMIFNDKI